MKINSRKLLHKPSFMLYHSFPELTDNYNDVFLMNSWKFSIADLFAAILLFILVGLTSEVQNVSKRLLDAIFLNQILRI